MAMEVNGAMPIGHAGPGPLDEALRSRQGRASTTSTPISSSIGGPTRRRGDETFALGARRHLDLTERDFVLADGSTVEFIDYDPASGARSAHYTLLGAHDDSCWSRGQAWAIAGYLRAWEALRDERDLATGRRLLDYWIAHSDADGVPPWDFKDPALADDPASVPLDTSAAAIVVEQLARLAVLRDAPDSIGFALDRLPVMLEGLLAHLTPRAGAAGLPRGMLLDGCFNQPRRYANRSELSGARPTCSSLSTISRPVGWWSRRRTCGDRRRAGAHLEFAFPPTNVEPLHLARFDGGNALSGFRTRALLERLARSPPESIG
jgi:unsaturated chondroitin disaccharide hydrolase